MTNQICFYHLADLDGHCSGALVKHFRPDVELVGIDYGDEFPWEMISDETVVYMVDFSLQPFERMLELDGRCAQLVWIDHHASAIEERDRARATISGRQESGLAACELCWEWFALYDEVPEFVRMLGRYDVWDHQPGVLEFQMGFRLEPETRPERRPELWENLIAGMTLSPIYERGMTIADYQRAQDAKYCSAYACPAVLPPAVEGGRELRVIAVNRGMTSSQLFASVWDPTKYDAMCAFALKPNGIWTVSLYTDRDDVDCGAYCKARGGGGHRQAAGFQSVECPFSPSIECLFSQADGLNRRRARFVYEGARIAAAAALAPIVPEPYDDRDAAFREQFEKVIERQMGSERSADAEALHDDWVRAYEEMGWKHGPVRDVEKKEHPDMVPYWELGQLERDKDAVFVALCEIARQWVYDLRELPSRGES
jgi:hypothetical protein